MTEGVRISQAEAECRAACAHLQVGDTVQHIHHEQWLEVLTQPIANRIAFILDNKPQSEKAERLRRMRPFADADRHKADADWHKADADRQKADADRHKADADWRKADADWHKADADLQKADADLQKADADWRKADADRRKADADLQKAGAAPAMLALHAEICGCPWSATTDIFGRER